MRPGQVLLGRKKRGLGAGKIVGIGGKCHPGEAAAECAIRELQEETGAVVALQHLDYRGTVEWRFPNKPAWEMVASVYVATEWTGDLIETDEIEPVWFAFGTVPYDQMWADARMWLPGVFGGASVKLVFIYNDDNTTIRQMIHLSDDESGPMTGADQ